MECAGKGLGTRCTGPPTGRCARCGAVAYCSVSHQDSSPHLVIAPNAGIAAYSSWSPTIELIKDMNVPAVFSDKLVILELVA